MNATYAGESYVVYGSSEDWSEALNLSDLNGTNGFIINGIDAYDNSGTSVSSAGDVNGDGIDDIIIGAYGADQLVTSHAGESYVVFGVAGTDVSSENSFDLRLHSGAYNLTLTGSNNLSGYGNGNSNTITGNSGANTLRGVNGNDTLTGRGGNDRLFGGAGNDTLNGGVGNDTLAGGDGIDTVVFRGFMPTTVNLTSTAAQNTGHGRDTITDVENVISGNGDDTLRGNNGANTLTGNSGNDRLFGGAGNDTLNGGVGNDTLVGGGGVDTVVFRGFMPTTVNLTSTAAQNTGHGRDTITDVENVISGNGDDTLRGNNGANTLTGNSGNDRLFGKNGNDNLLGGAGNDRLQGDAGSDILNGGDGVDTIIYTGNTAATVDLSSTAAQDTGHGTDTITNVENVISGNGADTLQGNNVANTLRGNNGSDTLTGNSGNDKLFGGAGKDRLQGDAGNDILNGGAGVDTIIYTGDTAATVKLNGVWRGMAQNTGHGRDTITGVENVTSGAGDDTLRGSSVSNKLIGNNGDDTLAGFGGDDTLGGGGGNDILKGGVGKDILLGGAGADTFVFTNTSHSSATISRADIIKDFTGGVDKIDLSAIDASTVLAGNNIFTFDGTTPIGTSQLGDIYYKQFDKTGTVNDHTMLFVDTDNDRGREMSIKLTGLIDLSADDFIL